MDEIKDVDLIHEMHERGYVVTKNRKLRDASYKAELARYKSNVYRFGVISCTHLGSRYQQLTHLNTFYSILARRRIKLVLHVGDLVDGSHRMHVGMEYEQFLHGYKAYRNYAVQNYPKRKGLTTWCISGNHDLSFYKDTGADIVEDICDARDDMRYLGQWGATVELPIEGHNLRVRLVHGSGGGSYARSYKLQKIVEQLAPEQKPNLLFVGHYHTAVHLPAYRNVEGFTLGCFQAQTGYLASKGLYPTVGGLIVSVWPDPKGIARLQTEWYPFYDMKADDY